MNAANALGIVDPPGPDYHEYANGRTPATPRKLRALNVAALMASDPPPIPTLAGLFLVRGTVTMLTGREGQGKSMWALGVAAAIGHGTTIAGIRCRTGNVLIIDAENGEHEAHRRIKGFAVNPARLVYVIADGFSLKVDLNLIDQLATEHKPDVIVLDSFRSLAPGLEENDSGPVEAILGPLRSLARRHNTAVLILHHNGKAGDYRGSTAIGAAIEIGYSLSREADDPQNATRRVLKCWKCRPAIEPAPRWISLDNVDGACHITETDPYEPAAAARLAPAREEAKLDILAALTTRGPISQSKLLEATGRRKDNKTGRAAITELIAEGQINPTPAGLTLRGVSSSGDTPHDTPGVSGVVTPRSGVTPDTPHTTTTLHPEDTTP